MTENTDLNITVDAWADIVIDNWLDRISKLGIGYSSVLEQGIDVQVSKSSNLPSKVEFTFPYYGKFVDMGVGKGVKLEDVKSGGSDYRAGVGGHRRKPKGWYSKVFYSEVAKLTGILAEKYGKLGALTIVENVDDNALRWTPTTL